MPTDSRHIKHLEGISEFYTVEQAARLIHVSLPRVYELAKRDDDPFPARRFPWKKKGSLVIRDELVDWVRRNARLIGE